MKTKIALGLLSFFFAAHLASALDTAFTYQGRLNANGNPANGNFEFQFTLFDTHQFGTPVAPISINSGVGVTNGLFTTSINFGGVFTGSDYWLDVGVRTNGSFGSFTVLMPRQKVTPTPYSLHSVRAMAAASLSAPLSATNLSGTLSDARLSTNVALLNGNPTFSGTLSASNFSGANGQPLEFKVNGATGFRLMPTTNTPNVIGGSGANLVSNGFFGATIAGGGATNSPNRAGGNFATVGGGAGNLAQGNINGAGGDSATVAGGSGNSALASKSTVGGGVFNTARGDNSVVAGGGTNAALTIGATVSGGQLNTNAGAGAFIGGGYINQISSVATDSVIGGGNQNSATQPYSTIAGGRLSIASAPGASILGGEGHTNSAPYASIGGGFGNSASGSGVATIGGGVGNRVTSFAGTVGGGTGNISSGDRSVVAGGYNNRATSAGATVSGGDNNSATNLHSVIGGGQLHTNGGAGAFIGGGYKNQISSAANDSVIGGGYQNSVNQPLSTIAGGVNSLVSGYGASILGGEAHTNSAPYSSIGGGLANSVSGFGSGTIGGGQENRVTSYAGTVGGGFGNISSGDRSVVAGGFNNRATSTGATVSGGENNSAISSHSVIGGGQLHTNAGGGAFIGAGYKNQIANLAFDAVIAGGYQNSINQPYASILGGWANTNSAPYSSIGGGLANSMSGPGVATIGGGRENQAAAFGATIGGGSINNNSAIHGTIGGGYANLIGPAAGFSTIPGGMSNSVTASYGFAAGFNANALHQGTFVWADSQSADFNSSSTDQFLIRAAGGVGINKNNPSSALDVNGTVTATGFSGSGAGLTGVVSLTTVQTISGLKTFADGSGTSGHGGRIQIGANAASGDSKLITFGDSQLVSIGENVADDRLELKGRSIVFTTDAGGVGNVGIGRVAVANKLEVEGDASKTTATAWLANSDRRIKTDVQTVENALTTLDKVRLVSFRYSDEYRAAHPSIDDRPYLNVIAQEFQEIFPDSVQSSGEKLPNGEEILQVDTYPLTIYSAAAIQELNKSAQTKDAEIQNLKDQNASLEKRLAALEKLVQSLAK